MSFPYHIGTRVSGMIPVGISACGAVTSIERTNTRYERVTVRFDNGYEAHYVVSKNGHCDYLTPCID